MFSQHYYYNFFFQKLCLNYSQIIPFLFIYFDLEISFVYAVKIAYKVKLAYRLVILPVMGDNNGMPFYTRVKGIINETYLTRTDHISISRQTECFVYFILLFIELAVT